MPKFYTRKKDVPLKPGQTLAFTKGRGYYARTPKPPAPKPNPQPAPPPVSPSVFAGKGLFTTSDAGSASNHPCDWIALQMDPEGDEAPIINNNPARIMYWQARPTEDIIEAANRKGVPYIAQAENMDELKVALNLRLSVPKALVANPSSWTKDAAEEVAAQGWDLILEWYWNAQPSYTAPNAKWPFIRLASVCFGIYSEGDPGTDSYVAQIPLSDYLAVWHGPFSIWKAEAMAERDWSLFDAC